VQVFSPVGANPAKLARMTGFGAQVTTVGDSFMDAKQAARDHAGQRPDRLFVEDGKDPALAEGPARSVWSCCGTAPSTRSWCRLATVLTGSNLRPDLLPAVLSTTAPGRRTSSPARPSAGQPMRLVSSAQKSKASSNPGCGPDTRTTTGSSRNTPPGALSPRVSNTLESVIMSRFRHELAGGRVASLIMARPLKLLTPGNPHSVKGSVPE
jgi:hypothetical protein